MVHYFIARFRFFADTEDGGRQSGFYESLEELNYALKTLIISDSFQAQRNNRMYFTNIKTLI